jgi:TRAP-type C4-dicarboxylate transport system permease small subunit
MSRAIGLILVITGLVLGVWFVQSALPSRPIPWPNYIVAALAAAMVSVGARYVFRKASPAPGARGKARNEP